MSTIQTQINLVHLQAGLAVPAVTQRTTVGSQFSPNAIEVTTTDRTVPLVDVTTPKQVMIKFISGDPVRIGLNYGTDGIKYPFRLSAADEAGLLPLDVEGLVEVSTIETVADVAGSLNEGYFILEDRNGEVKVVITNDGVTALTSSGRVVVVTITNNSSDAVVASAIASAFSNDAEITGSSVGNMVTLRDKHTGSRLEVADYSTNFSFDNPQPGAPSPTIHLKSLGTSQVVVAVAPY